MNNQSVRPEGTYGAPENFRGKAILGFVDLLGFSKRVMDHWHSKKDNPLDQLLSIKKHILSSTHTSVTNTEPPIRTYYPNLRTGSDSIVICIALPTEDKDIEHDLGTATWCMLGVVRDVIEKCLKIGFPVRGAIEFGHVYWTRSDVVGPVLVTACALESKVAGVARVLVGPELLIYLSQFDRWLESMYIADDGLLALIPTWHRPSEFKANLEKLLSKCPERYLEKYRDLESHVNGKMSKQPKPSSTQVLECANILQGKLTSMF